ncbi:hypothetical protein ACN2XU_02610 [Primorskyibacter sp. 2E107]|uniref:hypothetical protein n=1 Tax=Primorskyibacter sp. 2E107 TaxID=3403458 RepID=UPI003AF70AEA
MTKHLISDCRSALLLRLAPLTGTALRDAVLNEVMETGGTWIAPTATGASSHLFELSLHGVTAFGGSVDEAIHSWRKAATRALSEIEDDGFVTVHPPLTSQEALT